MFDPTYTVEDAGRQLGPFTRDVIATLWKNKRFSPDARVSIEGVESWMPLAHWFTPPSEPKPAAPVLPTEQAPETLATRSRGGAPLVKVQRSRGIYIALGLLLGLTGTHNLYAGYIPQGVVQFFLSGLGVAILLLGGYIAPIGFGVLGIVALWALVDLFADKDADGDPLG